MTKATEQELAELHGALARGLKDIIVTGAEVATKEGSVRITAPAAYFGAAIALLKNNNITADPEKNEELKDLSDMLQKRRQSAKAEINFREAAEDYANKHLGGDMSLN